MSLKSNLLLSALAASTALANPSFAADLGSRPTTRPSLETVAWNPWMIRVRALGVIPQETSSVAAGGVVIPGAMTDISNSLVPELDITYFFTKNIAAELILGVTPHSAKASGSINGLGKLGSVWLLPPTLTLQYHFTDLGAFKPYVGVGVNYTFFFNEKDKGLMTNFAVKDRPGLALQAGVDIMLDRNWGINLDVKKLFLRTEATGFIGGAPVKAKVDLNPWLVGAGVTYKF